MAQAQLEPSKSNMDVEKDITCSLCLEFFKHPKSLPCLHTYCKRCIAEYIRSRGNNYDFPCPLCKKKTKVTSAEAMPTNFLIVNMLERYNEQKARESLKAKSNNSEKKTECEICEKDYFIRKYCRNCDAWLCDSCVKGHRNIKATKDHTLVSSKEVHDELAPQAFEKIKIVEAASERHGKRFRDLLKSLKALDGMCKATSEEVTSEFSQIIKAIENAKEIILKKVIDYQSLKAKEINNEAYKVLSKKREFSAFTQNFKNKLKEKNGRTTESLFASIDKFHSQEHIYFKTFQVNTMHFETQQNIKENINSLISKMYLRFENCLDIKTFCSAVSHGISPSMKRPNSSEKQKIDDQPPEKIRNIDFAQLSSACISSKTAHTAETAYTIAHFGKFV